MSGKGKGVAKSSVKKLRSICIISDMELVTDVKFALVARELGKEMAARKITVVHSGASQGLGATVAQTTVNRNNNVIAVTPLSFFTSGSSSQSSFVVGREIKTQHAYERMVVMIEQSDAFIVMPGGFVTLEMFSSTILWAQARLHNKPVGLLNFEGYYDGLLNFLACGGSKGFISPSIRRLIVAAPAPGQLLNQMESLIQVLASPPVQIIQFSGDKRKRDEPDTDLRL